MSTPFVRAVLVTDGTSEHLAAVMAAYEAVDEAPPPLEVVLVGGAEVELPPSINARVTRSDADTYADAVNAAVAAAPSREGEFIWLLHDDTAPTPGSLAALLATAAKRPRAAVVGPAHVRWRDTSRLVSMGTTVSRLGARRVALVVEDDINQGQHDWRDDVMAVSLGAAVVRREAWDQLGGLDAGYEGFGDSLEFCRRAWAAGWDVVLAPNVHVRHAQESLYGLRSRRRGRSATHAVRRVSEWHHAFAWAPWWAVPLLIVLVPLSAAARIPVRLAQNVPRVALAELLVPFLLGGRLPAIASTARARRKAGATGRIEGRMFASAREVVDAVRQHELGTLERSRAERVPSEMVRAELDRARGRHRLSVLVTGLVSLGASAALAVDWVSDIAAGHMLVAPGLGVTDVPLADVWRAAWTGWSDAGFGTPGIDGTYAGLMLPLAAVPGGLRVGLALLLGLAPFMAAVIGWWAAGHATRAPWIRCAAGLVWGLWPPFLAAVLDGRVGPVIAHLALGAAALSISRAAGWRRGELIGAREERTAPPASASAGLAGALALTAATVAQPVLLLPVLAIVLALGVAAGQRRWRIWGMGAVPLVVGMPGLVVAARHLDEPAVAASILAREPGPGTTFEGSVWRNALGIADPDRWAASLQAAWPLGLVASAAVIVVGMAALASRRAARPAAWGVSIGAVGAAVAAWSAGSTAAWPDGAGRDAISGWPGTGASLVVLGALIAAVAAHGDAATREGSRFAAARTIAAAAAMLAAGTSVALVVLLAWPTSPRGALHAADAGVLPLAVPLDQRGAAHQRVLVLAESGDETVEYDVLTEDGATLAVGRAQLGPDGAPLQGGGSVAGLDDIAATVAAASVSGAADLGPLREWGIGTIVVAPGGERITGALDQNGQVTLAGGSERGQTYRIEGGPISRAWIETSRGERTMVPSAAVSGSVSQVPPEGGVLVIAVPDAPGWSATADGAALARADDAWGRAAFEVPAGADKVAYAYRDPAQRWWWWASAVVLAWALVGAVPLRRSKEVAS